MSPFTALVAAWNEFDMVSRHIRSFQDLDWGNSQLVISAGGQDGTYQAARLLAGKNVLVLEQLPGQGKQAALRECLTHAEHGLLYLTDADCLFDRSTLHGVFEPIVSADFGVSTGGSRPLPEQLIIPLVQYQACRDAFYFDHGGETTDGLLGRNTAITRTCLDRVHAFEEPVTTGTDFHLAQKLRRADIRIALATNSRIASEYPATWRSYLSMWRRWIKNLYIHDRSSHGTHAVKASGLALAIIAIPIVVPIPNRWLRVSILIPLFLALRSRYRDLRHGKRAGIQVGPATYCLLPVYAYLDQVAVLGAMLDLTRTSTRKRW